MWLLRLRWSGWLWLLVIANAACPLFFRCFITLDGPVHVLHAALLGDAIGERTYVAHGLQYDLGRIDIGLLDPVAILLLKLLAPELVETFLGVIVLLMFGAGAIAYVRAYAGERRMLVVLALPLSFSVLLLLGLFPFVFSIGLCLWLAARWVRISEVTFRVLCRSLLAILLCAAVHRGAPVLLGVFVAVHEVLFFAGDRAKFQARWSGIPRKLARAVLSLGGFALVATAVHFLFLRGVLEAAAERTPLDDLLHVRPLLLLDHVAERPLCMAFAALLLVSMGTAFLHLRVWRVPIVHHAPLCIGLLFIFSSLCIRTEWADLHYFGERAQLLGLLMAGLWTAVIVPNNRYAQALALVVVIFHVVRSVYVERRMAQFADERAAVVEVARHLKPGALVATVHCTDDWLLLHQFAHLATRHKGIVLSKRDKVWFERNSPVAIALHRAINGKEERWEWFGRCGRDPLCPQVDHVILIGDEHVDQAANSDALREVLVHDYVPVYNSVSAQIWDRR
ncbi:MAG: hypothetical protein ABI599_01885 [Flavobacteriales bacterium]